MKEPIVNTPVYHESAEYARSAGELDQYRASRQANIDCKHDIEKAIAQGWDGVRLKDGCALPIIEKYGEARTAFILANTLQLKELDGRFSEENMAWAQTVRIEKEPVDQPSERRFAWAVSSHPVKLDMFVRQARDEIEAISIRETPVYSEPVAYAMENGEMDPYWISYRFNKACAKELEKAIRDHAKDISREMIVGDNDAPTEAE